MTELQAHIEAMNDRERAWVAEDPKNRCAFLAVSDPKFWAEQGITTVAEFEEEMRREEEKERYKESLNY
jgi:hypothetical protein